MASITKRTNKGRDTYVLRWRNPDGIQRKETYKRRADADDRRRSIEQSEVIGLASVDRRAGKVTLADYAPQWIEHGGARARPLSPTTSALYGDLLKRRILPELGSLPLRSITEAAVARWFSHEQHSSSMQAAKAYRLLNAIMGTALRDRLIGRNPCVIRGAGQEHSPERPLIEPSQALALADAIDPRYRALVLLAAFGGLRLGELLGLKIGDLDLPGGKVTIARQAQEIGDGQVTRIIRPPKSAAGRRVVSLPRPVVEALAEHVDFYAGRSDERWLFVGDMGGPVTRMGVYVAWKRARLKVGLPELHIHDLRHLAGTMAAQAGATTKELMARIGHASPAASLRYQHVATHRDGEIADRMTAMMKVG